MVWWCKVGVMGIFGSSKEKWVVLKISIHWGYFWVYIPRALG